MASSGSHPFQKLVTDLKVGDKSYKYFDLNKLSDDRLKQLPYSIRILLESAVRNADNHAVHEKGQ